MSAATRDEDASHSEWLRWKREHMQHSDCTCDGPPHRLICDLVFGKDRGDE